MTEIQRTENKMGVQPIGKLLVSMSLPPMVSMLVSAFYNIVDSIFVARISEEALASVTLVFPIQMIMVSICVGIGVGLSSVISRRLGAKRQKDADSAAAHGFFLGFISWVFFALFGVFFAKPVLSLFTTDPAILDGAVVYAQIVSVGSIFSCFSICIERILQSVGNMVYPMIFNMTGAIINTILAPIFIIGYFGIPGYGIAGGGFVAVFGQFVAFVIAVYLFRKKDPGVTISFKGFKPQKKTIRDILTVAIPTVIMMAIFPLLVAMLNKILITYSATAVAVLGIYFRIQSLITMPVIGINQGALPLIGYNFGAQNRQRLVATLQMALKASIIIMAAGTAIFWIFPHNIMLLFSAKGEMLTLGVSALRLVSVGFLGAAVVIILIGFFQAVAHAAFATIISLVRQLIVILPLAYVFTKYFGVYKFWWAYPIAEYVALIMALIFFRKIYRDEISRMPDGDPVT
ncbi:MAG: MATE family efflux transporter [Clostridiales Family XIII bacterium]|jgi:putative MATE family efflux protein|nr:MATE family efflux transporter [Clostridiales Family XIII bacterium]